MDGAAQDIVEVIRSRHPDFRVPPGTGWLSVKCWAHDDSTSSASVNREQGYFKCHSCGTAGTTAELARRLEVPLKPSIDVDPKAVDEWEQPPGVTTLENNKKAAQSYHKVFKDSPAYEHIGKRGLLDVAGRFGLGFVQTPFPGHERFQGFLSIPYFRSGKVVAIRFRCLEDHEHTGHGKYNSTKGSHPLLYNTDEALLRNHTGRVGIVEGESDTWAVSRQGLPTTGVPGAGAWRSHWGRLFDWFDEVYVFCDGDSAGKMFGDRVTNDVRHARLIVCYPGEDPESTLRQGRKLIPR